MAKKTRAKEPEVPPAEMEEHEVNQLVAAIAPTLMTVITRASSVSHYMRRHDRSIREREVIALERIASAMEADKGPCDRPCCKARRR